MDRCHRCAELLPSGAKLCPCCNEPVTPGGALVDRDLEHLRLLSIFTYVYAGITAFFSCFPLLYVVLGVLMLSGGIPMHGKEQAPPEIIGLLFVVVGGAIVILGWTFAVLLFLAARRLGSFRGRTFCMVIAALSCLYVPLGTVLGVFTLVVLTRPSVRARLAPRAPAA